MVGSNPTIRTVAAAEIGGDGESSDPAAAARSLTRIAGFPLFFHRDAEGVSRMFAGAARRADPAGLEWRDGFLRASRALFDVFDGERPLCWFSIAFDPQRERSDAWKEFPVCTMVVPAVSLKMDTAGSTFQSCGNDAEHARFLSEFKNRGQTAGKNAEHLAPLRADLAWNDDAYRAAVEHALARIAEAGIAKIVLAREIRGETSRPVRPFALLQRLMELQPDSHVFLLSMNEHSHFIGASPERLARVESGVLTTAAIAGTVPRGGTEQDERGNAFDLHASVKLADEQLYVVRTIHDSLLPVCNDIRTWRREVLRLPQVMHFRTPIRARMLHGRSFLDAVLALHPTSAVAGTPRDAACAEIRRIERFDRGLYAGVLGWMNGAGEGDGTVAIRSALLRGTTARVFAGAGIIDGSVPADEVAETRLKMQTMLQALEQT
jgi:isochorismate synthase